MKPIVFISGTKNLIKVVTRCPRQDRLTGRTQFSFSLSWDINLFRFSYGTGHTTSRAFHYLFYTFSSSRHHCRPRRSPRSRPSAPSTKNAEAQKFPENRGVAPTYQAVLSAVRSVFRTRVPVPFKYPLSNFVCNPVAPEKVEVSFRCNRINSTGITPGSFFNACVELFGWDSAGSRLPSFLLLLLVIPRRVSFPSL